MDLLRNQNLKSLVAGKYECIVPVLLEAGQSLVDFRFLKEDLITESPIIKLVADLQNYLKRKNNIELIFTACTNTKIEEPLGISVLIGPSGSVKTRALFGIL